MTVKRAQEFQPVPGKRERLSALCENAGTNVDACIDGEAPELVSTEVALEPRETSENRLMWGNIGLHSKKDVIKFLDSISLVYFRVKTAPKWDYCFIQFKCEEECLDALAKLDGLEYKGKTTYATIPKPRQQYAQRDIQAEANGKTPEEQIADQVTPWWQIPYSEQLEKKNEIVHKLVKQLEKKLLHYIPRKIKRKPSCIVPGESYDDRIKNMSSDCRAIEQLSWIKEVKKGGETEGMICGVEKINGSPVTEGYRNKVEFSFGRDLEGNKSCGFLLGMFREGVTTVLNPSTCKNVPEKAKEIANILQEYAQKSELDVYDRESKQGFFRTCLARILQSGEIMLLLQVQPTGVDIQKEQKKFLAFINGKIKVDSLYWQESTDKFNGISEDFPMTLLQGEPFVTERMRGQQFRVSPTSFFQINPWATDILYGQISEFCINATKKVQSGEHITNTAESNETVGSNEKPGIILLDLCCGTGTIGISVASYVKQVIGVEICAEAIQDAERNAKLNNIENATYYTSKIEDISYKLFKNIDSNDKVIAVLDPPRTGVHYSVIKCIRDTPQLKNLIFVACE